MTDQGITAPPVLRPDHLLALANFDEAVGGLEAVCARISSRLADAWGAPSGFEKSAYTRTKALGFGYWEAWDLQASADEPTLWLDWNAWNGPWHPDADGRSLLFLSGLTAWTEEDLVLPGPSVEREALLTAGVVIDEEVVRFRRITDDCVRFAQTATPDELLVGRTLQAQADSAAAWVIAGFKALTLPIDQLVAAPAT